MSLSIEGILKDILKVESGTSKAGKAWQKQGFVIDTGAQFNPLVCFSLFGDEKIALLRNFTPGQKINVSFNLSSREFNGKWYHNIDAWKVEAMDGAANSSGNSAPLPMEEPSESFSDSSSQDEEDDLPF